MYSKNLFCFLSSFFSFYRNSQFGTLRWHWCSYLRVAYTDRLNGENNAGWGDDCPLWFILFVYLRNTAWKCLNINMLLLYLCFYLYSDSCADALWYVLLCWRLSNAVSSVVSFAAQVFFLFFQRLNMTTESLGWMLFFSFFIFRIFQGGISVPKPRVLRLFMIFLSSSILMLGYYIKQATIASSHLM